MNAWPLVLALIATAAMPQPGDPDATFDKTRARMYSASSAAVWRAVPEALKAMNLVPATTAAASQFVVASSLFPAGLRKEQRSELHVFVSPFAEPARVYAGSVMRSPSPDAARLVIVRYNTGELESAFFSALERIVKEAGQTIPMSSERRAAAARGLLGAAADADPCLARLESDEPPALGPEGTVAAPLKIPESDVTPVVPAGKQRDRVGREARIDTTVTEDGAIAGARLINTAATDEAFAGAVLGAASLWHYRPAKVGGCHVPVRLTLAVQFAK